jgi:hypothetical protein
MRCGRGIMGVEFFRYVSLCGGAGRLPTDVLRHVGLLAGRARGGGREEGVLYSLDNGSNALASLSRGRGAGSTRTIWQVLAQRAEPMV